MKFIRLIYIFTVIIFMVYGCTNSQLIYSNMYISEQDSQYSFINKDTGSVVEVTDGYYFLSGPNNIFLYYYDKVNKQAIPVCNKPNCLHADESNSYKIANCNACLGEGACYLNYYKGSLYYVVTDYSTNGSYNTLYKISLDGSKRQKILIFKEELINLQIHRGYVFFATTDSGTIAGQESKTKTKSRIYWFKLDSNRNEAELIEEITQIHGMIGNLLCYGNNLYYQVLYYEDASLQIETSYINRFNIQTKTVDKFLSCRSAQYTIFNDKFVYYLYPQGTFICDLDGQNSELINEYGGFYLCNDSYLIIDNYFDAMFNIHERMVRFIDKNWQTVKTISLSELDKAIDIPLGCSNDYYFLPEFGKSNDIGDITSLNCIPIDNIAANFEIKVFYDFVPKVPYYGIITED